MCGTFRSYSILSHTNKQSLKNNLTFLIRSHRSLGFYQLSERNSTLFGAITSNSAATMVKTIPSGLPNTTSFALHFFDDDDNPISPWHDIPLSPSPNLLNLIIEIPKFSKAKFEITTELPNNPIKQDTLKGEKLRFLDSCMYWNYGALPQTWESPTPYDLGWLPEGSISDEFKGLEFIGDNDPLDALEIGPKIYPSGEVVQVKVLGALSLIDQGEIDWKIITIAKENENFEQINTLEDVDKFYPGTTTGIIEFFRWYKTPSGKKINKFLLKGYYVGRGEAMEIVGEMVRAYRGRPMSE